MEKKLLAIAGIFGMTAVIMGAFGAHGFKSILIENNIELSRLDIYNKGVQYQFYHTFALFITLMIPQLPAKIRRFSAWCFIIGILFFSGSLYLLSLREFIPVPTSIVGPITPVGGMFFILGWVILIVSIIKSNKA